MDPWQRGADERVSSGIRLHGPSRWSELCGIHSADVSVGTHWKDGSVFSPPGQVGFGYHLLLFLAQGRSGSKMIEAVAFDDLSGGSSQIVSLLLTLWEPGHGSEPGTPLLCENLSEIPSYSASETQLWFLPSHPRGLAVTSSLPS